MIGDGSDVVHRRRPPGFRPTPPLHLRIPLKTARGGGAQSGGARDASRRSVSCHLPSEVPLGVQLFPADGVTWVVSLPTALAGDTIWPEMEWIEALAPAAEEAETEMCEEVCAR